MTIKGDVMTNPEHSREKHNVALLSVFAAIFLTGSKLTIGFLTGSLGLLSEALHSGLDLVAAGITYFSVRISDKRLIIAIHLDTARLKIFPHLLKRFFFL